MLLNPYQHLKLHTKTHPCATNTVLGASTKHVDHGKEGTFQITLVRKICGNIC